MSSEYVVECVFDGDSFCFISGCDPEGWLEWLRDGLGEDYLVRYALEEEHMADEGWAVAMKTGLAPGQVFTLRFFGFTTYGSGRDGEYDDDFEAELVGCKPLPPGLHLDAWEHLFTEWNPPFVAPTVTTQPAPEPRWRDTCGSCGKRRMVEEFCGDQSCRECLPAAQHDAAGVALEPYY